jgi:hypothetical protein
MLREEPRTSVRAAPRRLKSAARQALLAPAVQVLSVLLVAAVAAGGCTRESVRVALEAQQRADRVQQDVFERQHEALCVFLYRDLRQRLERDGTPLSQVQAAALNEVWNDRDLVEFWRVQHERARALRLVGVDAKLYGDQSIVDLLYKSLVAKADRVKEGVAAEVGRQVAEAATAPE